MNTLLYTGYHFIGFHGYQEITKFSYTLSTKVIIGSN
jgi:hypothetical protein